MHRNAVIPIASIMLTGGSAARCHVSRFGRFFPNQMKYGTFNPVCRNVPADASINKNPIHSLCSSNPAETIMDLLTNPLNNGNAEIESPPTNVNTNVHGIFFQRPPNSVNLLSPVMNSTEPQPM